VDGRKIGIQRPDQADDREKIVALSAFRVCRFVRSRPNFRIFVRSPRFHTEQMHLRQKQDELRIIFEHSHALNYVSSHLNARDGAVGHPTRGQGKTRQSNGETTADA